MADVTEDADSKTIPDSSSPSSSANHPNPAGTADEDKGSDSDGDGAEEILEESPDKRWSKRREKVKQRDVPGIDAAFLAMDNETGNEVVWNEVQFSERKNFREQEEKLKSVFDNLTQLVHINLVKFHKYWTDSKSDKPRIIFITEYMSSGSMSRFLHRARSSGTPLNLKVWKKWTTQILSALNYLHSCDPPIVHANLTCNTVFIQQNGLIKIGCVAPNAIHHHVKTFRENLKNMHYVAPEFDHLTEATTEADIYSFGICALEMATTGGLCCNGTSSETTSQVTPDVIRKAIETLEDQKQRNFIEICLNHNPSKRPTARELLFHKALFEVHSLKLLAAHAIVNSKLSDHLSEDDLRVPDASKVAAVSKFKELPYCEQKTFQVDLDKFLEDVRNGIYPLFAFAPLAHTPAKLTASASRIALTPSEASSKSIINHIPIDSSSPQQSLPSAKPSTHSLSQTKETSRPSHSNEHPKPQAAYFSIGDSTLNSTSTPAKAEPIPNSVLLQPNSLIVRDEGYDTAQSVLNNLAANQSAKELSDTYKETRSILNMQATIEGNCLKAVLQLDDHMNRQLVTEIHVDDTAEGLVSDLIEFGFICDKDSAKMCDILRPVLDAFRLNHDTVTDSGKSSRKSSKQQESEIVMNNTENVHKHSDHPTNNDQPT
ncbi:Nuclear receptor-binding protein-like protein [Aphelenchoides besseyi]|nr:Nuclear receptor-binding protein-like protein [Aphelenchoides besseyi]